MPGHPRPRPDPGPALALLAALTLLATLTLLALLALLTALPLLALLTTLLAERVVEQLLLARDDVAELVHHLAHALVLALVGHAARLQTIQQVAQLAQHLLGHVAVARARHVLEILQHLIEILRRHHLVAAGALRLLLLALGLLAQLVEELRQCLPQLLHQALDLLVGCALLDGFRQALLGGLQRTLGIREVAVLDAQRHVPQLGDDAVADRTRGRLLQAVEDGAQAEIDLQIVDELLRLQRQRLERAGDLQAVARVLDQLAPLLDDGAGQRLGEAPLGQHQLDGLAAAGLAGQVLGHQRQLHLHAGPGMVADLVEAGAFGRFRIAARQPERQRRRPLIGRPRALLGFDAGPGGPGGILLGLHAANARLGRGDAVVVLDLEGELQPAARRALGLLGDGDLGRQVRDDLERPAADRGAAEPGDHRAAAAHLVLQLGYVADIGRRRRFQLLGRLAVAADHLEGERAATARAHDQHAAVGHLVRTSGPIGGAGVRAVVMVGAVGQHEGGLAGIGRRRDPGVEACVGALGERPEAEGGGQPVGGAVADDDGEHEHAEQQQGAQRDRGRGDRCAVPGGRRAASSASRRDARDAPATAPPCAHPRRPASAYPRRRTPDDA